MKTDKEKFESFFQEMGVEFDTWKDCNNIYIILSVAQAHFYFDKNKNEYLGVESDSPSRFNARKK